MTLRSAQSFAPLLLCAAAVACAACGNLEAPDTAVETPPDAATAEQPSVINLDTMALQSFPMPGPGPDEGEGEAPLAWGSIAVDVSPAGSELYVVPLAEYELNPTLRDSLTALGRYYVGTSGDRPTRFEGLERAYKLVARRGERMDVRDMRIVAGRADTVRIQLEEVE